MDTKKFVALLRKVIREEVKQALREELQVVKEQKATVVARFKSMPPPRPAVSTQRAAKALPKFGGPVADILNETLQSMVQNPASIIPDDAQPYDAGSQEEWPTMGGSTLTSRMFANDDQDGFGQPAADYPAHAGGGDPTMAFVKDYRAVADRAKQISDSKG